MLNISNLNKKEGICVVTISNGPKKRLFKTIKSVDRQIYKPDQHIIVCRNIHLYNTFVYHKKFRKFLINKDTSLYNAMNVALKYNEFSHVIFLNSDDIFLSNLSLLKIKKYLKMYKTIVGNTILKYNNNLFYPKKIFTKQKKYLSHPSYIALINPITKKIRFSENDIMEADGIWMKKIIKYSNFIKSNTYLSIHNLGGISSNPSLRYIFHYNKITQKLKLIIKYFLGLVLNKESYYKIIYFKKFNHYKSSKFNCNV